MKLIDGFMFYNELELLEYRLAILYDIVDKFVIVESAHTHSGNTKELYFETNKSNFSKYLDKIIHIVVNDFPYKQPNIDFSKDDQWKNENFQRNCISRGIDIINMNDDDIIIVSDLDEIPDPIMLQKIKDGEIITETATLGQDFYYYNLNSKFKDIWYGTRLVTFKKYKELGSCQNIRDSKFDYIEHAGWHLSYFGDKHHIQNKLTYFAHQEMSRYANPEHIQKCIDNTTDLFGRSYQKLDYILISDNTYLPPLYEKYLQKFYKLKILFHIPFHYNEERFPYINRLIDEMNTYGYITDLVIHTNKLIDLSTILHKNTTGCIQTIYHDMTSQNPWYLTHKHRNVMENQKNKYDIFINAEDDILLPKETLEYWLKYKNKVMKHNYNLGVVRIEFDKNGVERLPDLGERKDKTDNAYLKNCVFIEDERFILNDRNPYCAFFIYDKFEFNRFVNSKYYDINNIQGYGLTESAAVGLHGRWTDWYRGTVIPLTSDNKLTSSCKIYHQTNKFANLETCDWDFIEFDKIVQLSS